MKPGVDKTSKLEKDTLRVEYEQLKKKGEELHLTHDILSLKKQFNETNSVRFNKSAVIRRMHLLAEKIKLLEEYDQLFIALLAKLQNNGINTDSIKNRRNEFITNISNNQDIDKIKHDINKEVEYIKKMDESSNALIDIKLDETRATETEKTMFNTKKGECLTDDTGQCIDKIKLLQALIEVRLNEKNANENEKNIFNTKKEECFRVDDNNKLQKCIDYLKLLKKLIELRTPTDDNDKAQDIRKLKQEYLTDVTQKKVERLQTKIRNFNADKVKEKENERKQREKERKDEIINKLKNTSATKINTLMRKRLAENRVKKMKEQKKKDEDDEEERKKKEQQEAEEKEKNIQRRKEQNAAVNIISKVGKQHIARQRDIDSQKKTFEDEYKQFIEVIENIRDDVFFKNITITIDDISNLKERITNIKTRDDIKNVRDLFDKKYVSVVSVFLKKSTDTLRDQEEQKIRNVLSLMKKINKENSTLSSVKQSKELFKLTLFIHSVLLNSMFIQKIAKMWKERLNTVIKQIQEELVKSSFGRPFLVDEDELHSTHFGAFPESLEDLMTQYREEISQFQEAHIPDIIENYINSDAAFQRQFMGIFDLYKNQH